MSADWAYQPLKADVEDVPVNAPQPRRTIRRHLAITTLAVGALVLGALYACRGRTPLLQPDIAAQADDRLRQCPSNLPPPAAPPAPTNLWATLTVDETTEITRWLESDARKLNLTQGHTAQLSDNYIFHIEAARPPKAAALAYLADPQSVPVPDRWARVTVHHGADAAPYIQDYLVGPLPCTGRTVVKPLKEIYHRDPIPYHARGVTMQNEWSPLVAKIMAPLKDVTQDLFGGVAVGLPNDTLVTGAGGPWSFDGEWRRFWISWRRNVPGPWLHPVNFFQYVDASGTDPTQWKLLKIVYNHQVFPTVDSFLAAYHNGTLKRLPDRPDQDKNLDWSTRKRTGAQRDLDHLPGPRQVSFAGLRFRVDRAKQYVSWLGWGMYLGFDRDMGLSLWDIRFRGERLIYELAPQEAIAQYAGNDPMQATTAWLDRFFGMGSAVRDMIPGYDCPYEAVYLPATTHGLQGTILRKHAICIFEHDTGRPITRHTGYSKNEFGAVRGYVLTVRSISTVGNYDYLFDYMFHIDGTIEVRLSASGYLQGGFWESQQEGYGTAIRDTTMGSLHDHVINFKVDLDIVGTSNSLLRTWTDKEEITQPWLDEDWGTTTVQQKIHRKFIENEDEALLKYPLNFQGNYALVNQEETNQWGIARGYAIHPGYSPVHNTIVGSKRLLNNANWARYNLAVSKRKESEPASSSMWNLHLPGAPAVDFHKFFDGENITQEDLVAWVNVGMHHLPQAEDAPNTRTNLAASSFFLTPLNYFDWDVSMESTNAIILEAPATPGGKYTFNDYGVGPVNCVPPFVDGFSYEGLRAFTNDGKPAPPVDVEEMRKEAEMYHRIKIEL